MVLPYPENADLNVPKPPTPEEAATILGDYILNKLGDRIDVDNHDELYGVLIQFFKGAPSE